MLRLLTVASVLGALVISGVASAGDAAKGEQLFQRCKACHSVGEGENDGIGPTSGACSNWYWGPTARTTGILGA